MKACCVFALESPHRGDSNEYTQHAIINIKKKITLNYPNYNNVCSYGIFSLGTQERVRDSRGKQAIGVRAIEVLLDISETFSLKGSSQHKVGGEWFEIKLGKISRMLVKYEVLPIPNVIFVC